MAPRLPVAAKEAAGAACTATRPCSLLRGKDMAFVEKETVIEVGAQRVWEVIGDFTDGPVRMAPGFVTASRLEKPDERVVTFVDGTVVHERLVEIDHQACRLVYSVVGGSMQPESDISIMQVVADGDDRSRFVWSHQVQPDGLAETIGGGMDRGMSLLKQTLETRTAAR